MTTSRKNILFVAVPTYGHLIPMLELARKLAPHHAVIFAVSAETASLLEERGLYNSAVDGSTMKLLPIDDRIVGDVDDPTKNQKFSKAMPLINQGITKLLKLIPTKNSDGPKAEGTSLPVDLVIVGTFLGIDATRTIVERRIPYILFVAGGLNLVTIALSYNEGEPFDPADGQMLFMSHTPDNVPPDRVVKTMFLPLKESVPYAAALVVNSLQEFEQPTISRLGVLLDKTKPVFCIGPLLPENKVAINDPLTTKFRQWMDRQKPLSVIYVSFGTVTAPKPDQLKIISQALMQLD